MAKDYTINKDALPKHIAIIMDGNGRWAKKQGLLRVAGHEKGTKAVREAVEGCAELGVKNLTLYAFSTENWNRPKFEVDKLMNLLVSSLKKEIKTLQDNKIKLSTIGTISSLPKKAQKELAEVKEKTKDNTHMNLTLALSYGSREEIVNTIKNISKKVVNKELNLEEIDENSILVKDFHYLTPTASSGERSIQDRVDDFRYNMKKDVNNLESISKRIEIIKEVKKKPVTKKDKKRPICLGGSRG